MYLDNGLRRCDQVPFWHVRLIHYLNSVSPTLPIMARHGLPGFSQYAQGRPGFGLVAGDRLGRAATAMNSSPSAGAPFSNGGWSVQLPK